MKLLIGSATFLAGSLALSTTTLAQGSDDCATATAIAGQGTFAFDNTAASTGTQGQLECGAINNDVWYSWTADATGVAIVSLCAGATHDTKLAAYPGGGCPLDGTSLACNDDSCGLQSEVTFPVTNGTAYMLQVGSFSASGFGVGTFDVTISSIPTEDDCATPGSWSGQGLFPFDNSLATTGTEGQNEVLCDFFSQTGIANDLWYTWTADATGTATFTTCGASFDTKIALWPGTGCPTDGTSLACNDDDCGLQSTMTASVVAGQQYTLQIGTYITASGGAADMDISIASTTIGTSYCTSVPNSTGAASVITATGSDSLGAANLELHASNAPTAQFGIFFYGNTASSIPFGNGGFLCASGAIQRLYPPIVEFGGSFDYTFDFASYGAGLPSGGASTFFQCWFRDATTGPDFFNTSNGLEIVFQP